MDTLGARVAAALVGVMLSLAAGCEPTADGGAAPPDATPCPEGLPGPPMIPALVPPQGSYCIDATEVTQDHYAAFLADVAAAPPDQPAFCQWNEDLAPAAAAGDCGPDAYDPETRGDRPAVCVDWCDAAAYCAWAGKRLCGRIGGGGLQNNNSEPWSFTHSQWYNACSDSGLFKYPYGDTYRPEVCNSPDAQWGRTIPATADPAASGCHGIYDPYDGLFDMVGNVAEWEDGCTATSGNSDFCYVRGGAYQLYGTSDNPSDQGACLGGIVGFERRDRQPFVGFRCCLD